MAVWISCNKLGRIISECREGVYYSGNEYDKGYLDALRDIGQGIAKAKEEYKEQEERKKRNGRK